MKESKRRSREEKKMLEWLQRNAKDQEKATAAVEKASLETEMDKTLEGTAAIAYWENGKVFIDKTCRICKQTFATNYRAVDTCSRRCLKIAVERIGLTWNPEKSDHERWAAAGSPPLIVHPAALKILKEQKNGIPVDVPESPVESSVPSVPESSDSHIDLESWLGISEAL